MECIEGCIRKNALVGIAGRNMKIHFTFRDNKKLKFAYFDLRYNYRNLLKAYRYGKIVKTGKCDARFTFPRKMTIKDENVFMFELLYRNLSIVEDNAKEFKYVIDYMAGPNCEIKGKKILNVAASKVKYNKWKNLDEEDNSNNARTALLIGFILGGTVALLIITYLFL